MIDNQFGAGHPFQHSSFNFFGFLPIFTQSTRWQSQHGFQQLLTCWLPGHVSEAHFRQVRHFRGFLITCWHCIWSSARCLASESSASWFDVTTFSGNEGMEGWRNPDVIFWCCNGCCGIGRAAKAWLGSLRDIVRGFQASEVSVRVSLRCNTSFHWAK